MIEVDVTIKIPFHDVDLMAIAWHGHYVKYFEIARSELFSKIGYNYQEMADSGYAWPVIGLNIKYVKPATLGKNINVRAKIVEFENRLKVDFLITDLETGRKLTKGTTTQVAVDMNTQEMCFVSPDILFEKLGVKR